MKVGDLVMIGGCGVGVLLEQQSKVNGDERWVVHWFDDNDWTWEYAIDLEVIK